MLTDSWYWNQNAASHKWAQRYVEKVKKMPSSLQAADDSAVTTYLNAVKAAGSTDPDRIMAQSRITEIHDFYAKGYIPQDGSMIHDMYLMQVKAPAESNEPWDYYKVTGDDTGRESLHHQSTVPLRRMEITQRGRSCGVAECGRSGCSSAARKSPPCADLKLRPLVPKSPSPCLELKHALLNSCNPRPRIALWQQTERTTNRNGASSVDWLAYARWRAVIAAALKTQMRGFVSPTLVLAI